MSVPFVRQLLLVGTLVSAGVAQDQERSELRAVAELHEAVAAALHTGQIEEPLRASLVPRYERVRRDFLANIDAFEGMRLAAAAKQLESIGNSLLVPPEQRIADLQAAITELGKQPGPRHGLAGLLSSLVGLSYGLGTVQEVERQSIALFLEWPREGLNGAKRVWLALDVGRWLTNHCRSPAAADEVLSTALAELRAMPPWNEAARRQWLRDPDLWITRPERPLAASHLDCLGQLLNLRGFARLESGRLVEALADLLDAQGPLEATANLHRLGNVQHNLASTWLRLGKLDRAEQAAHAAIASYENPAAWDGIRDLNGLQAMHKVLAKIELRRPVPDLAKARAALLAHQGRTAMQSAGQQTNTDGYDVWCELLLAGPFGPEDQGELDALLSEFAAGPHLTSHRNLLHRLHLHDARRWLRLGDLGRAATALQRAADEPMADPEASVRELLLRGEIARLQGDPKAAMEALRQAAARVQRVVESERIWAVGGGVGEFQVQFRAILDAAVRTWVAWQQRDPSAAQAAMPILFETLAGFHGSAELYDAVVEELRSACATVPEAWLAERQALGQRIDALQRAAPGSARLAMARRRELQRTAAALDTLEARILREAAKRTGANAGLPPVSLQELQAALLPGEVFVEFVHYAEGCAVLSATPQEVAFDVLPDGEALRAGVVALGAWTRGEAADLLGRLGRNLLPEGSALRRQIQQSSRVMIAPGAELATVPFSALPFCGRTLGEQFEVTLVGSGASLVTLRQRYRPVAEAWREGRFVAFGNPRYQGAAQHPELHRGGTEPHALAPLPATAEEVLAVAKLFAHGPEEDQVLAVHAPERVDGVLRGQQFTVCLGASASESEVVKLCEREVRFLHFACHGSADALAPELSYLALTLSMDRPAEGLLRVAEFGAIRGDYELVALSACETSAGPVRGQEGPASLARAAMAIGARRVLATQRKVDDALARDVVTDFYRHWRSGMGAASALAVAQRQAVQRGANWAEVGAFTLWGESR